MVVNTLLELQEYLEKFAASLHKLCANCPHPAMVHYGEGCEVRCGGDWDREHGCSGTPCHCQGFVSREGTIL